MKTAIKLIASLIVGIVVGVAIGAGIAVLFTDTTLIEFIDNFRSVRVKEMAIAALTGIATFLLSTAIIITAHEAGHLVCGLLSEYKFVSFRIFSLTFIKVDGKIRIKKFSIAGTGGQCLLYPPELPEDKVPTGWYNAGGVAANIVLLLIAAPFFLLELHPLAFEGLMIFCLTDLFVILTNGIPMKLGGIGNDAYNMIYLGRNRLSKRALMLQLRSNALIQEGTRPRDMPEEWFEWKTDIDYKNPLEVSIPLMHASRLIDEMKWEEAYREFDELYSHKDDIMQLYANEIACELAFCAMMTDRCERAVELLDKKLREYIKAYSGVMSSKQRILCGIAHYLDHDRAKAEGIYRFLEARKDEYLLRGEVDSDLAIMAETLDIR